MASHLRTLRADWQRDSAAVIIAERSPKQKPVATSDVRLNPVLYVEFENINGADKSLLEIVNHDERDDLTAPNGEARLEKKREIEAKLILGSCVISRSACCVRRCLGNPVRRTAGQADAPLHPRKSMAFAASHL